MNHAFRILEFLEDIAPRAQCDDCLSSILHIEPRQTVNAACRTLATAGRIERVSYRCAQCDKVKLVNSYLAVAPRPQELSTHTERTAPVQRKSGGDHEDIDIEKARTEIVRICRDLWGKHQDIEAARGLAAMIVALRNADILPTHIANMMHTVSGLRNVYVYEGRVLDSRTKAIAENAFAIIGEWFGSRA